MHENELACLKKENAKLGTSILGMPSSTCKCKSLKEKNSALNKKNIDLHAIITKFTLGEKNFKILHYISLIKITRIITI